MRFCGINLRAISQGILKISILDTSFNITNLLLQPHLPEANELMVLKASWMPYPRCPCWQSAPDCNTPAGHSGWASLTTGHDAPPSSHSGPGTSGSLSSSIGDPEITTNFNWIISRRVTVVDTSKLVLLLYIKATSLKIKVALMPIQSVCESHFSSCLPHHRGQVPQVWCAVRGHVGGTSHKRWWGLG